MASDAGGAGSELAALLAARRSRLVPSSSSGDDEGGDFGDDHRGGGAASDVGAKAEGGGFRKSPVDNGGAEATATTTREVTSPTSVLRARRQPSPAGGRPAASWIKKRSPSPPPTSKDEAEAADGGNDVNDKNKQGAGGGGGGGSSSSSSTDPKLKRVWGGGGGGGAAAATTTTTTAPSTTARGPLHHQSKPTAVAAPHRPSWGQPSSRQFRSWGGEDGETTEEDRPTSSSWVAAPNKSPRQRPPTGGGREEEEREEDATAGSGDNFLASARSRLRSRSSSGVMGDGGGASSPAPMLRTQASSSSDDGRREGGGGGRSDAAAVDGKERDGPLSPKAWSLALSTSRRGGAIGEGEGEADAKWERDGGGGAAPASASASASSTPLSPRASASSWRRSTASASSPLPSPSPSPTPAISLQKRTGTKTTATAEEGPISPRSGGPPLPWPHPTSGSRGEQSDDVPPPPKVSPKRSPRSWAVQSAARGGCDGDDDEEGRGGSKEGAGAPSTLASVSVSASSSSTSSSPREGAVLGISPRVASKAKRRVAGGASWIGVGGGSESARKSASIAGRGAATDPSLLDGPDGALGNGSSSDEPSSGPTSPLDRSPVASKSDVAGGNERLLAVAKLGLRRTPKNDNNNKAQGFDREQVSQSPGGTRRSGDAGKLAPTTSKKGEVASPMSPGPKRGSKGKASVPWNVGSPPSSQRRQKPRVVTRTSASDPGVPSFVRTKPTRTSPVQRLVHRISKDENEYKGKRMQDDPDAAVAKAAVSSAPTEKNAPPTLSSMHKEKQMPGKKTRKPSRSPPPGLSGTDKGSQKRGGPQREKPVDGAAPSKPPSSGPRSSRPPTHNTPRRRGRSPPSGTSMSKPGPARREASVDSITCEIRLRTPISPGTDPNSVTPNSRAESVDSITCEMRNLPQQPQLEHPLAAAEGAVAPTAVEPDEKSISRLQKENQILKKQLTVALEELEEKDQVIAKLRKRIAELERGAGPSASVEATGSDVSAPPRQPPGERYTEDDARSPTPKLSNQGSGQLAARTRRANQSKESERRFLC